MGWQRLSKEGEQKETCSGNGVKISLIIPFHDHIENIALLAENISLDNDMEIVFVNDSFEKNREIASFPSRVKIIDNVCGKGKKQALHCGILAAKGKWVVQSDIDCTMDKQWLKNVKAEIEDSGADMLILPVLPDIRQNKFWKNCFALDFLSMVASGLSFAAMGYPFLANGAAMAYKKEIFELMLNGEKEKRHYFRHPSGDDVFLLHFAKKRKYKIAVTNRESLAVTTEMPNTLPDFLTQRIRWASKAKYYQDKWAICITFLILGYNFLLLGLLAAAIFFKCLLLPLIGFWTLKIIVDFLFLYRIVKYYSMKKILNAYLSVAIFYPIYIIFAALSSLVVKPVWGNRFNR